MEMIARSGQQCDKKWRKAQGGSTRRKFRDEEEIYVLRGRLSPICSDLIGFRGVCRETSATGKRKLLVPNGKLISATLYRLVSMLLVQLRSLQKSAAARLVVNQHSITFAAPQH